MSFQSLFSKNKNLQKDHQKIDSYAEKLSWYESNIKKRPSYDQLQEDLVCNVLIIGGGFTGLSAAYYLAKAGVDVVLLEAKTIGSGASGRNGGQLGTGQRQWVEQLEKNYGFSQTKELFDLAQEAKTHLLSLAEAENFDCDFQKGQISAMHRPRFETEYKSHIETMQRYGYDDMYFLQKNEISEKIGSSFFHGGIYDQGTGHINPLKAVVGLAKSAKNAGAKIYENSLINHFSKIILKGEKKYKASTKYAKITADHVLFATNAYHFGIKYPYQNYVMPVYSYIGAMPLGKKASSILKDNSSVDDSRFVVRYFRKADENIFLFGGAEVYTHFNHQNMFKIVKKQILEIYPDLKFQNLTHLWSGAVGITVSRMPIVQKIMDNVTYCGGYSGHGVMIAPYIGKLYADKLLRNDEKLYQFKNLKITPFPGGKLFRPLMLFLALRWFAMLDRL